MWSVINGVKHSFVVSGDKRDKRQNGVLAICGFKYNYVRHGNPYPLFMSNKTCKRCIRIKAINEEALRKINVH